MKCWAAGQARMRWSSAGGLSCVLMMMTTMTEAFVLQQQVGQRRAAGRHQEEARGRTTRRQSSSEEGEKDLGVVFLVSEERASPFGLTSPAPGPEWKEVAEQLLVRLNNLDARVRGDVWTEEEAVQKKIEKKYEIAVGFGVRSDLRDVARAVGATCYLVDETSSTKGYAGSYTSGSQWDDVMCSLIPWSAKATGKRVQKQASLLFARHSSEDAAFAILLAMNALVTKIPVAANDINPSWEKGFRNVREFANMASCCRREIFDALTDPQTKKAVDALNALDLRDQVGSYRVIVSNETPQLEAFSLCILQQNNCFECDAPILTTPVVEPLSKWRGRELDRVSDRQLFIGHLDDPAANSVSKKKPYSWKIVCGANPAYDAFPMQHQIFYPSSKSALWYDPVFCVETLDDELVWTKRHYRCVPRGSTPGRWTLTTLDNGIVSLEHWTVVDAADDLSWAVFHYSGAASKAGQSYQGCLLCSENGLWPRSATVGTTGYSQIQAAIARCGLKMWELYGHAPPDPTSAPESSWSYMWAPKFLEWANSHPPPLDRIGDISITKWRQRQRDLDAAAAASQKKEEAPTN